LTSLPNLIKNQLESFKWVKETGIKEIFKEFSPMTDYQGKKFTLEFEEVELGEPKFDEYYAKNNKVTYEAPLRVSVKLKNKITGSEKRQEIFMADFPVMTNHGTFIINGVERVLVPQLIRSFGVLFGLNEIKGKKLFGAKLIPARGAWIEIETEILSSELTEKENFPLRLFFESSAPPMTKTSTTSSRTILTPKPTLKLLWRKTRPNLWKNPMWKFTENFATEIWLRPTRPKTSLRLFSVRSAMTCQRLGDTDSIKDSI